MPINEMETEISVKERIVPSVILGLCLIPSYYYLRDQLLYVSALLLLVAWCVVNALPYSSRHFRLCRRVNAVILIGIAIAIYVVPISQRIISKNQGEYSDTHDGVIQTEYATELFLNKRNIYSEDVPESVFSDVHSTLNYCTGYHQCYSLKNPAIFHFAYPPLVFIQLAPFYWLSKQVLGWFDMRIILLAYLLSSIFLLSLLNLRQSTKYTWGFLLFLNLYFVDFFLQGRNDIMVFFWLFLCYYLLDQERYRWSIIALAVACLIKQSAWMFVPFFYCYLYYKWSCDSISSYISRVLKESWPAILASAVLLLPFALWDPHGLWTDLITYQSGKIPTSYPVNGYGLLAIFLKLNIIDSPFKYYPTMLPQLILYFGVLIYSCFVFRKNALVHRLIFQTILGVFLFWFCSRYYNNSHIEFTLSILALGWLFKKMVTHEQAHTIGND